MTDTGEVLDLAVAEIGTGPKVRAEWLDMDHVWALQQRLDEVPPIVVRIVDGKYRLVDGVHRHEAHRRAERDTIRAVLVDLTDAETLEQAVTLNRAHGKPLSPRERRSAAVELIRLSPEWSDRRIADAVGLTHKAIAGLRPSHPTGPVAQLDRRTGADNKRRPVDAAAQRERIAQMIRDNPDLSDNYIAKRIGCSASTVGAVRASLNSTPAPVAPASTVEPGDDREGPEADTSAPPGKPGLSLAPAPQEREPLVGDFLTTWPAAGSWSKDDEYTATNAGRDLARFMDRRVWRKDDPDLAALVSGCPAGKRENVAAAVRCQAESWVALADALDKPARPSAVEAL